MMRQLRFILLGLALVLSPLGAAWAWGATGHYVIAAIAYDQLKPAAKKEVNKYSKVYSRSRDAEYRFMMMSSWADRIKQQGIETYNQWHFMPYPYMKDGIKNKRYPRETLMWAMRYNQHQWRTQKSFRLRAKALAFIVHLFGDAHQPLHCVNLFDNQFPRGDKGGLRYTIKSRYGDNLHEFWDNGAGLLKINKRNRSRYVKKIEQLAKQLQHQYPFKKMHKQASEQNPKRWTRDSYALAVKDAYSTPYNSKVSAHYIKMSQKIVRKQLVLAGYRLAYWLNHHAVP